jgi:dipeptidyl aminopeptidase/acylaminoacyl peptidase
MEETTPDTGTARDGCRPFTPDDLYLHRQVTEIDCTAAGRIACSVQSVDRDNDGYTARIWALSLDGAPTQALTQGPGQDTSPRWSPDGELLAFVSSRTGSPQLHVLPAGGGEARRVGDFSRSVSSPRWAPDGKAVFVAASVQVEPDLRGRPGEPPKDRPPNAPEVAWRLPYKEDGIGYLLQRQIHLFRVEVDSGEHARLTCGAFDVLAHDVCSDGRRIAYSRTRPGRLAHRCDLWICAADGSGHRQLTHDHAMVMAPHWSPDGQWIAFTGALEDGDAEPRLWRVHVHSGEVHQVGDVDVADPLSLRWTPDSRAIVFVRAHRGRHQIARIGAEGSEAQPLVAGDMQIAAFGTSGDAFVYSIDHPSRPSEVLVAHAGAQGGDGRQLSDFNAWWHSRTPVQAKLRRFEVPDGEGGTEAIEGWLLAGPGAPGPRPLLDDMHGGPASYALLGFDAHVYWQVLAARGWAVLALNSVGSASYGHAFCRRLAGHWGERDLPQHLAAVAALQAEGVCDGRVAAAGKSYGGFLSAWACGHTDVFKAAVVMAPVGNIETHYGTSDGGYYADPYYVHSAPKLDRAAARALSPLQSIEKSRTPTLFLQGKEDERCPKCQSEEMFVSLMCAGETPAELVLYPGEGHGFLAQGAPSCRADAVRRTVDWLVRHAAGQPTDP